MACPGKSDVWQTNRARQLIKVHVLIPELRTRQIDEMKFAALGAINVEGNLPRSLISSATLALSKVFPKKSRTENRAIVQSALVGLKREAKKGPEAFQKLIQSLETKVLGRTRPYSPLWKLELSSSRPGDAPEPAQQELVPESVTL